jgi:hypothetical protein
VKTYVPISNALSKGRIEIVVPEEQSMNALIGTMSVVQISECVSVGSRSVTVIVWEQSEFT